jgi:hypothetical protein
MKVMFAPAYKPNGDLAKGKTTPQITLFFGSTGVVDDRPARDGV